MWCRRSTIPVPLPLGLVAALQNQLDLGSVSGSPTLEIFTNQAWFPVGAQLTGATADASRLAGEESLVRADLSQAVPSMVGADEGAPSGANEVAPGAIHIAVPFDERVVLEVDGIDIPSRPGFGVTTAFDVTNPGTGVLGYRDDPSRAWWRVAQMILWLAVLVVAAGARSPFGRRRAFEVHDETLIDLSDPAGGIIAGEALAPPVWDDVDWDEPQTERVEAETDIELRPPSPSPSPSPSSSPMTGQAVDQHPTTEPEEVDLAGLVAQVDEQHPSDDGSAE